MLNIFDLFKKAPTRQEDKDAPGGISATKTWFEERYEIALIQRNVMVLIVGFCLVAIAVSVAGITKISLSKEFDPFVIQIDDTTGAARVVNPVSLDILSGKEELSKYFMKKYLIARETYNAVDFDNYAKKVLRLLFTPQVYGIYWSYIRDKDHDPTIIYGQKNTTTLSVKSWSKLDEGKYIIRFAVSESTGSMRVYNKIAIIEYQYTAMDLTDDERDVNPVGFQVTGYRVDDDHS